MVLQSVLRTESFAGRLRTYWTAAARTVIGDIIATAIAIGGVGLLFVAGAFAAIWLMRAASLVLSLLDAG